ncbi:Hint domain-containing protein [Pseudogemmobacter bohemicus]|uniref:Hint domain-containing protein n=1 Tax=Pseudogemmobacter bohemicus TaxID=2250708 RepID=UPI000DD38C8F|nr:Hint domain-containing protein [Pseudogemmobacter bohemicus]
MIHKFTVISNRDIGLQDQSWNEGSFTNGGTPRTMAVSDDDGVLDDENGIENDGTIGFIRDNESWDSSGQLLQGDIDSLGVDGHVVQSVYVFDVTNTTTGETGKAYMLRIYDSTTPGDYGSGMSQVGPYYYAFTIPVGPGDSFTFSNGDYIGQVPYTDLHDGGTVCFLAGTRIATPQGEIRVERLSPGDEVMTREGIARLRWLGAQRISQARQIGDERLRPIRIGTGALGQGLPTRDLYVSQQHRILIASQHLRDLCGASEALVPACHLLGLPGITRCTPQGDVIYVHFLCDQHEIVFAEGAACETLLPAQEAMKSLSPDARAELELLLPELPGGEDVMPATHVLSGRVARLLARRHQECRQALTGRAAGDETSRPGYIV